MGGFGSGQRYDQKKETVEQCIFLSCSWLLQHSYLDLDTNSTKYGGVTWHNFFGRPMYTLDFSVHRESADEMFLALPNTDQYVRLQPTPQRFGGVRWWFLCPKCDRRCAKLYMPPPGSVFLCRLCHNLSYDTCRNSMKIEGYTAHQLAQGLKKERWWRYPPWRRKRDRRPDYKDRGARLREIYGDRIRM